MRGREMEKGDVKKGLVTLCIGGGMGIAMCIERSCRSSPRSRLLSILEFPID
jgi:hypothetical protein